MFLPPTVFGGSQRVVAREAGKLRIFGPCILFVNALALPARRPKLGLRRVFRVPIRVELSSAAASPRKTNPARNTNPDARRRSFRDRQICFLSRGGTPGIFPCDESRCACRSSPAPRTFHAATNAWCGDRAKPRPAHDSFRRIRLQKFQTRAPAVR